MFTLKFYGKRTTSVVCAEFYEVTDRQAKAVGPSIGATVTVRPHVLGREEPGQARAVEFHVGLPARPGSDTPVVCFVYNVEGRCVSKIGPFGKPPAPPRAPKPKAKPKKWK